MSDREKKVREELKSTTNYEKKQKLIMQLIAIVGLGLLGIYIIPLILPTFKKHGFTLPKSYNDAIYYAIDKIRNETKELSWINDRSFNKSSSSDKDPIIYYVLLKHKNLFLELLNMSLSQKDSNNQRNINNLIIELLDAADYPPKVPLHLVCSNKNDLDDDGPYSSSYIQNLLNSEGKNNNKLANEEKSNPLILACAPNYLGQLQNQLKNNGYEQSNDRDSNANVIEQNQQDQGENISDLLENDLYGFLDEYDDSNQDRIDDFLYGENITISTDSQYNGVENQDSNIDFRQVIYNPNDGEELNSNGMNAHPDQQVQNDGNENNEYAQSNGSYTNEYAIELDPQQQDDDDTIYDYFHFS